jgi:alkanesulfonate monooxygenase SsuD/methylene tetrahydromethanopterin reductase-like flavin-dependent oxidoreductase (luciferase family)
VGGVPPEDRLARFDEAVRALRALLGRDPEPFVGRFYSTAGATLEPPPGGPGRPRIWLAGWGGPRALRRAAELGDGWLASGYNTTPERFAASWERVREGVRARGGDPDRFANGVATLWTYVTGDRAEAERVLAGVLSPLLGRPVEALRELALPIGPAEVCAERLGAFAAAGAQRAFVWPLGDEIRQLALVAERVLPLISSPATPRRGPPGRPAPR